jgi:phosphoesterase RecJ-like protein
MSKMLSLSETVAWLKENDFFLILTHRRPDGDALGSAGALAQGLREFGKTAYVLFNPETTPRYACFVEDYIAPEDYVTKNIIAVDTASADLLPKNAAIYKDSVSLCIDHHKSNMMYAERLYLDANRASCGEIIFEILMMISGSVSSASAECLYVALSTDTGCFSFGNTTANTLYVASLLIEAGAPSKELNKRLFRTKTHERISLEGMLFCGLEYFFDGKVAIASITLDMLKASGADEDDMDDIAAIPGSIEGVCVGITIRELLSEHDCKVSVRTRTPYDAQAICAHFGGGGHNQAAGFVAEKTIGEIKAELMEVLDGIA